jgi:hypothetical protein
MQLMWMSGPTDSVRTVSITAHKVLVWVSIAAAGCVLLGILLHFIGFRIAIEVSPSFARSLGGVTTEAEIARQPLVPVMAHFADEDKWIPLETVETFKKAHPSVQVFTYAAHHGFNCDQRASWHAPSAQLARERTLAFFKQHLG